MKHLKIALSATILIAGFTTTHAQWSLTGNSISSGNFLGTTNNETLLLKRNSTHVFSVTPDLTYSMGWLSPSNPQYGPFCFAIGDFQTAGGNIDATYSFAIGNSALNNESGNSFSIGNSTRTLLGNYCLSMGNSAYNDGSSYSFSIGNTTLNSASLNSFAIGNNSSIIESNNCFSLGNNIDFTNGGSSNINSLAIGTALQLETMTNSVLIGYNSILTGITNSFAVGLNSDVPTFIITPASGGTTTGNVGIGTTTVPEKLNVNGSINLAGATGRRIYMGGFAGSTFGIAYDNSAPNYGFFYTEGSPDYVSISPNGNATNGVMNIMGDGKVGIGTNSPGYKLHLKDGDFVVTNGSTNVFKVASNGYVTARQVDVNLDVIPDYVFAPEYKLMTIAQLEQYVNSQKHLPNIKSADEYEVAGSINLGELNLKLLEKVEELTLYIISLNKDIQRLEAELAALKSTQH